MENEGTIFQALQEPDLQLTDKLAATLFMLAATVFL